LLLFIRRKARRNRRLRMRGVCSKAERKLSLRANRARATRTLPPSRHHVPALFHQPDFLRRPVVHITNGFPSPASAHCGLKYPMVFTKRLNLNRRKIMKTILIALLVAVALMGTALTAQAQEKCKSCCTCETCTCDPCNCCKCETCTCAK